MAETILVTGASGFIGRHVVRELLCRGKQVVASSAHPEKVAGEDWFQQVKYLPLNLAQLESGVDYYAYFGRPDAMIHLAWEGLPHYRETYHLTENLPRHRQFLFNLMEHGLRDLTVSGTCFEYGMQEGCLDEAMTCRPDNPYAQAKQALQLYLQDLSREYGCIFRWLRLFYMYGAGQNEKSLVAQLEKALSERAEVFNMSGGEQVRDFLPVERMAAYIVAAALQTKVTGVINCCSGQPVTVRQFVETYLAERGQSLRLNLGYYPYPDYEPMRFWGDDTKLKKCLHHQHPNN